MRSATVVFPVPGFPVKDICSVGVSLVSASFCRARSMTRSEAISRIRVLTGFRPTSSRSSGAQNLLDARALEFGAQPDRRGR